MTSPCINNDFNDIQRTHHKYFPLHHCNLLLTVCMIESCLKNIVSYLALLWLCITSTKQWGCSDIILQDVVRVVLYDRWLFDTSGEHFWKHSLGYRSALVRFELCGSLPRSNLRHRSGKKTYCEPTFPVPRVQWVQEKALHSKGRVDRGHLCYGAVPKCLLRVGRKSVWEATQTYEGLEKKKDGRNRELVWWLLD